MPVVTPSTPDGVAAVVVGLMRPGRLVCAVDGADAADPGDLADRIVTAVAPRRAVHVRADGFWRPASLRLELGRHDVDEWLDGWLDVGALRREVLDRVAVDGSVVPELRDPVRDRSVRTPPVLLPPDGVVLVSGRTLLGRGLRFDVSVHVHLSADALRRRTPAPDSWTLPGIDRYEADRRPDEQADLVVRADDARRPAFLRPERTAVSDPPGSSPG